MKCEICLNCIFINVFNSGYDLIRLFHCFRGKQKNINLIFYLITSYPEIPTEYTKTFLELPIKFVLCNDHDGDVM